jgi:DNA helicase INO80
VGEDRGPRGGLRDILNPVSSTTQPGTPGAPAPPRPHSSFNLRSPTQQSDYHHPNTYTASPSATVGQPSGSRSILNNPFGSAPSSSLPPPLQAPPNIVSAATSGLQHPPRSPLHAPTVYYPTEIRDRDPIREKSRTSSFYDPTTDGNRDRERRVSETGSWRSSAQASPPKVSKQSQFWRTLQRHPLPGTKPCPPFFVPNPSLAPSTHQPICHRSSVSPFTSAVPTLQSSTRHHDSTTPGVFSTAPRPAFFF